MREYPSDEELEKVRIWDAVKDPHGLIEFLKEIWHWPDWGVVCTGTRSMKLVLHTGGWSGNESIVQALEENLMFFTLFWLRSDRGGHYYFRIKKFKAQNSNKKSEGK